MGFTVGTFVGAAVGDAVVGTFVGVAVGLAVGTSVGVAVGASVGVAVGEIVGCAVGLLVGSTQFVGLTGSFGMAQPVTLPATDPQTAGTFVEKPWHCGQTWHASNPVLGSEHPLGGGVLVWPSRHGGPYLSKTSKCTSVPQPARFGLLSLYESHPPKAEQYDKLPRQQNGMGAVGAAVVGSLVGAAVGATVG